MFGFRSSLIIFLPIIIIETDGIPHIGSEPQIFLIQEQNFQVLSLG